MSQLRFAGPPRRSLRLTPSAHHRRRPDLRRTVHASLRAGGEPVQRHWRAPGERMRRMVLLLDVSGSMEPYARALLRFVQAAVAGRQKVEAFAMGTRLTRITKELGSRDPDHALRLAGSRVSDPQLLADQMQRLQRITHKLVWVNPLKVTPGYAPLARGMAAALPYVDHFVEGHSMAAMEELARVISSPITNKLVAAEGIGHA